LNQYRKKRKYNLPRFAVRELKMNNRIVLITGGNKGLGYEAARRLKELGYCVIIGARDPALGETAAEKLGIEWVSLEVTNTESVHQAALEVEQRKGRIDILINNAGIPGARRPAEDLTGEDAELVFAVNVAGPVRVIHNFLPLLRKSSAPVIVNVSSGMGSFSATHDPERPESKGLVPIYSASKSALTMLTTRYAKALPGILINAADPGYTATDFTDHLGTQTVSEGTDAIIELATLPADGPTGIFIDRFGTARW
jgi:NAD(P)-dependent dehydrogenase (short-subunit alcohol dehydrogenase family)